jgi:glucose/arabinose dehydrogenase
MRTVLAIGARRRVTRVAHAVVAAVAALAAGVACDDSTSSEAGSLAVAITGLAPGLIADVTVTGPGGFTQRLPASMTLAALAPGSYTVAAAAVTTADGRWNPAFPTQAVAVAAGAAVEATVTYMLATARLAVTVTGVPAGTASVTVTGPGGFTRTLDGSATLDMLAPGSYTIVASDVTSGEVTYRPALASQTVLLPASTTPTAVTVAYGVGTGTLAVTIGGLPAEVTAAVRVEGPTGFVQQLTGSATLSSLEPGQYTLIASHTGPGLAPYSPAPLRQTVDVAAGQSASASVAYTLFELALEPVVSGLTSPVHLAAPAGDARLFVVEQPGRIRIIQNGQLLATPFLDISARVRCCGEEGLLSVAFDAGYATNGFFYVYLTNTSGNIDVERYTAPPGGAVADPSPTPVLNIPHPTHGNHNGGLLMFGADGMLYVGTGDGGGGGDPFGNGQNLGTLLGKLLRLDVRSLPYVVPPSNPFVGQAGRRGEIWAYGLRNPWRYDFDLRPGAAAADLYIADVGQNQYEEVNVAPSNPAGLNYGWNIMEGMHCFPSGSSCSDAGLTRPAVEYSHAEGCSVTGGHVYRGSALPEVAGQYFYSDYCSGWLASMASDGAGGFATHRWDVTSPGNVLSFGEDAAGELYVLTADGAVYRIVRR